MISWRFTSKAYRQQHLYANIIKCLNTYEKWNPTITWGLISLESSSSQNNKLCDWKHIKTPSPLISVRLALIHKRARWPTKRISVTLIAPPSGQVVNCLLHQTILICLELSPSSLWGRTVLFQIIFTYLNQLYFLLGNITLLMLFIGVKCIICMHFYWQKNISYGIHLYVHVKLLFCVVPLTIL